MGRTGTGKPSQGVKVLLQVPAATTTVPQGMSSEAVLTAGNRGAVGDKAGYFPLKDVGALKFGAPAQGQVEPVAVQLGGLVLIYGAHDGGGKAGFYSVGLPRRQSNAS